MAKQIRLGFIGAGSIARAHATGIRAAGGEIVGVVDVNRTAAERFAHDYNADYAGTGIKKLLAIDAIDAVLVCSPNAFHAPQSIAALQAGKHVFCEKPMATSAAACRKMIQAAKKARKTLTIGFVRRFMSGNELIKSKVDAGKLGRVYYAESKWLRRRGVPGYGGWFTTKKLSGGGPLIDLGCHMLDLVMWFLGHPRSTRVFATSGCHLAANDYVYTTMWGTPQPNGTYDVEDYASAMIRFANGTCMLLQTAWAINIPENDRIETWLTGDKAGASSTDYVELVGQDSGGLIRTRYELAKDDPFHRQMACYLHCLAKGKQPPVTGQEGLMVQQALDAIYRSSKLQREVVIKA